MKNFLMIACLLVLSRSLLAQQPSVPASTGPKTLADALAQVNWDSSRGVLLVVNPQSVKASVPQSPLPEDSSEDQPNTPSPLPVPELTSRGYDARALAEYFARLMIREGSVTVLAPQTMTILNTHPGSPNLYADLERWDLMIMLMGTLTSAQWKQIGSEEGLGREDLTSDQQEMFEYLLPNPFAVEQDQNSPNQRFHEQATPLSAAEREQVRLRVTMETTVEAKMVQESHDFPVVFDRNKVDSEKPYLAISHDTLFEESPTVHGVKIGDIVPNRLKQSQLDLKAPVFNASISLEPVDGKLTVGDLIARVGAAVHLEMYADRRIAHLPIWVKGQSAPATDVLRALCLGVCGTFRQVGPAYLLTDDVLGIGTRRALLNDWDADAQTLVEQKKKMALQNAAALHAAQYLTWSDDEPVKLPPDMLAQLMKQSQPGKSSRLSVPLTALTNDQQQFIQNAATTLGKVGKGQFAVTTDQVRLRVDTWLVFVVPGIGQVVNAPLTEPSQIMSAPSLADVPIPSARALLIQPVDVHEASQAVLEAKKRGFTSLWVQVPYDNDTKPLKAALQAGQKAHLPVWAVVRLLSRPSGTPNTEINILGQSESVYTASRPQPLSAPVEWARLDTPGLASALRTQLLSIAKMLGLAGLVLRDTAAPGFDLPPTDQPPRHPEGYGADTGYTLPERLDFLRRNGADPIDIVPYFSYARSDQDIPGFPEASNGDLLAKEWSARRYEQTQYLMTSLYQSLHTVHPSLPLLIQGRLFVPGNPDFWVGSWDKPQGLPQITADRFQDIDSMAQSARAYSHSVIMGIPAPLSNTTPMDYAASMKAALQRDGKGWDGAVLDLSDCSMEKVGGYLDGVGLRATPASKLGEAGQK